MADYGSWYGRQLGQQRIVRRSVLSVVGLHRDDLHQTWGNMTAQVNCISRRLCRPRGARIGLPNVLAVNCVERTAHRISVQI